MTTDRARLKAIKETIKYRGIPSSGDVFWLVGRLEEAIDLLHIESCSGLLDQSPLTTDFLSRFEDKP